MFEYYRGKDVAEFAVVYWTLPSFVIVYQTWPVQGCPTTFPRRLHNHTSTGHTRQTLSAKSWQQLAGCGTSTATRLRSTINES